MSETQAFERTASARRRRRRAYGCAELHHRLVERSGPLGRDEASGDLADPSLRYGPRHVVRDPEEAGDDAVTFPSTAGTGTLKAMLATAPAVYGPIPGRAASSSKDSGSRPPCRSTIA